MVPFEGGRGMIHALHLRLKNYIRGLRQIALQKVKNGQKELAGFKGVFSKTAPKQDGKLLCVLSR
ncbi:hypothetical protein EFB08_07800 [Rufibacter latericius]|uniref:Uncharacterized protein n=1 Tax=Rufibacter latericius TaxID=2487040 RepID=A0A3M9MWQ1_9BACT|nr:hypothetical protein EFB08_07800 [Rufibacter latericius]